MGEILYNNKIEAEIIDLENGEEIPDPTKSEALIVMGGPASANDITKTMKQEIVRIEQAIKAGVPYLGVCLGMQALVKACGGKVIRSPVKEVGWKDLQGNKNSVKLTEQGKNDPIFSGLETTLPIFQLHGETVETTDSMQLLAAGKHCTNQVIKIGNNAYGFQGHLEMTTVLLDTWLAEDDDLKRLSPEEVKRDYATVRNEYESNSKMLFNNFLKIARLI
ncbi:type 1 glutamine amidotransferase [uncultured Methanomethylovorans sp.]|uniref:type 1 glutamine amidotransferase n=1 Tax=uncultured Methanomethylovorans sp. TaxID=183759 RepID=UPI00374A32D0